MKAKAAHRSLDETSDEDLRRLYERLFADGAQEATGKAFVAATFPLRQRAD